VDKKIRAVDAFAGAGGLGLGLSRAGMELLYSFDLDPVAIATQTLNPDYGTHRAEVRDVKHLLRGRLLDLLGIERGALDVLAGGPPCQGFSVQRGKSTSDDPRNELVAAYAQLIDEVYPRVFLMENVPGLAGKRGGDALAELWRVTDRLGYRIHQKIVDAQDFGVPQRRKRLVVIGVRPDVSDSFSWPDARPESAITVRDTIEQLPQPGSTAAAKLPLHRADRPSPLNIERLKVLKPGQGRDFLPEHLLAACHKRTSSSIGHRNVYGRMAWDEVSPTITARFDSFTRGKFGHPEQLRSISLLEGALLQSFPIDYLFAGNKVEIARQIGNAVPPRMAESLGIAIIHVLKGKEPR